MLRIRRLVNLLFRSTLDREIESELEAHIEMRIEDNIARGMSPADARRDAVIRFGNSAAVKEGMTSIDASLWLSSVWADLRYAVRQLIKSPGFALTAVLTMAFGIGANLAVFQLLYGVMFAHLPVREPAQIYSIHAAPSPYDGEWFFSYPAYRKLRDATKNAVPVFARSGIGDGILQQTDGSANRIDFQLVSDNFFETLGLSPVAGRFFENGEDEKGESEFPVVLRYGFFKQHFSADRSLIGRRATLNGVPIVVTGVAPDGFNGVVQGMAPDVWLPLAAQSSGRFGTWFDSLGHGYGVHLESLYQSQPSIFWLWTLARVPEGAKATAITRWMPSIAPDISMMAAATKDAHVRAQVLASHVELVSAQNGEGSLSTHYSLPLMVLMAMAGLILLVGCLNLANLQMARLMQREREIATRIALGASRTRVLCQVATEAALLAALGGPLALLTSRVSSVLLLHWASGRGRSIPINLNMSPVAYLVAVLALLGTLICFGLLPAWFQTRKGFSAAAKSRVRSLPSLSRAGQRWSNLLLAGQVSLSLLVVCTAMLFGQTLRNLSHIDVGMDREHLLSAHVDMRSTGFADQQKNLSAFYSELIERLSTLPGVRNTAIQMCTVPKCGWNTAIHVYGKALSEAQTHGEEDHVGLGYFHTVGIPLLQGRDFTTGDTEHSQKVAILNHAYARKLFGNANPIGQWIAYQEGERDFLVVGEVADALVDGLRAPAPPFVYLSLNQNPQPVQTIVLRAQGSLLPLPAEIRDTLHALAPALPITDIVSSDLEFHDGLSTEQLLAKLTSVFGALTLAMAALGFYGLLSFRLARRTAEIGIRMAVGATRAQVGALFMHQTMAILLVGAIPGVALAIATGHMARKLLYGAGTMDLWAVAFAFCILATTGVFATLVPAYRASSIDPMQALRNE